MKLINSIYDSSFLKRIDKQPLKTHYVKIQVLDNDGLFINSIEGKVVSGNITIDGSSNIRRAGNISFIIDNNREDIDSLNMLLSLRTRIQIFIGLENYVDNNYDNIIWFKQGIFVITQINISHNLNGLTININFKDKMCLLNGELGGTLPTSVIFDSYNQMYDIVDINNNPLINPPDSENKYLIYRYQNNYYQYEEEMGFISISRNDAELLVNNSPVSIKNPIYDIIQTAVCNYGGENISNIVINDIELKIKQLVRNTSGSTLWHNEINKVYEYGDHSRDGWIPYEYNEDVGYIYTSFVYPGDLITNIGDNVCTVLDAIVKELGNYEYFYDIDGYFIFQEKKNYLNTSYTPVNNVSSDGYLLDEDNYYVDFNNTSENIYTFEEGSILINSYTNNPNLLNIKNDFHIWGNANDNKANPIHYHIVIKEKPEKDVWNGTSYTYATRKVIYEKDSYGDYTGRIRLAKDEENGAINYTPSDWRAELYLQGLESQQIGVRPDMYQQEILDMFDTIYNMKEKMFKTDNVDIPNNLRYYIDYISEDNTLSDISVDTIGTKICVYNEEKINRLYNKETPDFILYIGNSDNATTFNNIKTYCDLIGQKCAGVSEEVYNNLSIGTSGYCAVEVARNLIYQYTDYCESITLNSIPIYYLEPNRRIEINDRDSGIYGDYIINSISLPLAVGGQMSISASRALTRI